MLFVYSHCFSTWIRSVFAAESGQRWSFWLCSESCEEHRWSRLVVFGTWKQIWVLLLLNNDKISLNNQSWPKKEKEMGKKYLLPFLKLRLLLGQLTVAMVRISVSPHARWNTEINIKREVEFLLRNPHARPPSDWPSQDVGCRPWSSTSCASTPNTSCPLAPALINRKITVRGEVGVSTLMCHFIFSVLLLTLFH